MASRRAQRRRSCERKVAYPDQTAAVTAMIRLKRRGAERLHTYRCPFAGHWHVGHLPKSVWQRIEARRQLRAA